MADLIRPSTFWLLGVLILISGCGSANYDAQKSDVATEEPLSAAGSADNSQYTAQKPQYSQSVGPQASQLKIIYVADVGLVVDDFAVAEKRIPELVGEFSGYMSDVTVSRSSGYSRSGRWVARIPVARFEAFLNSLGQVGVPESRRQTAQDVTEEYVDLEARIKNNKRLEERILKLIEERSGEIKEVVEAERELARVRGEIEQMEGRLRYLQNRTSLSTVTINVREERDYVPPEAPSFAERITENWTDSLIALREFGEDTAVFLVRAAPWLVMWAIILTPIIWFLRRKWRNRRQRKQALASPRETPPAST